jgi:DNA repair protein RadA/Sms
MTMTKKRANRDVGILIRVTKKERERIRAAAEKMHMRPSPLARVIVMQWIDLHEGDRLAIAYFDDRIATPRAQPSTTPMHPMHPTLIEPIDRVLGGGLVAGGSVMVIGKPGVGKTTLLAQMAASMRGTSSLHDGSTCRIMWASADETLRSIRIREKRIGISGSGVETYANKRDVDDIIAQARGMRADVLVVDSIQTIATKDVDGLVGSSQQCSECARRLDRFGKDTGCSVVIVCQDAISTTNGGLEHLVDVSLTIEEPIGESSDRIRILRAEKNRFASINEIGRFEMLKTGMRPLSPADETRS